MLIRIIIGLIIGAYVAYLIVRQVRNAKAGNYCGSCSGCPSAACCASKKRDNDSHKVQL